MQEQIVQTKFMKNYHLYFWITVLIFSVISPLDTLAQPYLIQSKEGYSNVRESGNPRGKIQNRLKNNTIVLIDQVEEQDLAKNQWIKILYYENLPFSIVEIEDEKPFKEGYIHRSQLLAINTLGKPKAGEFSMQYLIKPTNHKDNKVEYYDESSTSIKSINGIYYYLADCGIPEKEIDKAEAKINGVKVSIPRKLLIGIGPASQTFDYYKLGDIYLAVQEIGDGACANYVVWLFEKDKLTQRFVGWEY